MQKNHWYKNIALKQKNTTKIGGKEEKCQSKNYFQRNKKNYLYRRNMKKNYYEIF